MNVLIAPDSFKDSLSAKEVAKAIAKGIHNYDANIKTTIVPMADGGEGTVEALIDATGGKMKTSTVTDPLQRKVEAHWGISGDGKTAIIEMAAASGIELLAPEERNAWITTTYGTGEIIKEALDNNCNKILIGIGGSATNDCGTGMAAALGFSFLNNQGADLPHGGGALGDLACIDASNLDPRIKNTQIVVACDVSNPLCGPNGASHIYGPQKGATKEMVPRLDDNLRHCAEIIKRDLSANIIDVPGAGAAGGMGAGLMAFCGAELKKGFNMVAEAISLEDKIANVDLIITGEGKMDGQTKNGKTIFGVAQLAKKYNKPVIAIAGTIANGAEEMYNYGVNSIFSIINKPMPLADALSKAPELLERLGENIIRLNSLRL